MRQLHECGVTAAYLYGDRPSDRYSALHNFYLLLAEPGVYGLPAEPVNPHNYLRGDYLRSALGLIVALAIVILAISLLGG